MKSSFKHSEYHLELITSNVNQNEGMSRVHTYSAIYGNGHILNQYPTLRRMVYDAGSLLIGLICFDILHRLQPAKLTLFCLHNFVPSNCESDNASSQEVSSNDVCCRHFYCVRIESPTRSCLLF